MQDHLRTIGGKICVAEPRTLRQAGGASCILQHGQIVRRLFDRIRICIGGNEIAEPDMKRIVGDSRDFPPLQAGKGKPLQRR
jgi:hypothetical protein